jgi:hypothetical protein
LSMDQYMSSTVVFLCRWGSMSGANVPMPRTEGLSHEKGKVVWHSDDLERYRSLQWNSQQSQDRPADNARGRRGYCTRAPWSHSQEEHPSIRLTKRLYLLKEIANEVAVHRRISFVGERIVIQIRCQIQPSCSEASFIGGRIMPRRIAISTHRSAHFAGSFDLRPSAATQDACNLPM